MVLGGTAVVALYYYWMILHGCFKSGSMRAYATCVERRVLRLESCIRKRSREACGKTSKDLWNPCDSEDIEHKRNEASFKLGKDGLNHHHDCRLFIDKLRN